MSNDVYEELAQLAHLVRSLQEQGSYEEAIQYVKKACDLAKRRLGDKDLSYASTQADLGGYTG